MNIDQRRIKSVFEFGFEQMNCDDFFGDKKYIYHNTDFEIGGKMYDFRNYTVGKFKREFSVTITFC